MELREKWAFRAPASLRVEVAQRAREPELWAAAAQWSRVADQLGEGLTAATLEAAAAMTEGADSRHLGH